MPKIDPAPIIVDETHCFMEMTFESSIEIIDWIGIDERNTDFVQILSDRVNHLIQDADIPVLPRNILIYKDEGRYKLAVRADDKRLAELNFVKSEITAEMRKMDVHMDKQATITPAPEQ